MAYLGTKPANQVIDSTLIADGTITPSDLSTGKPVWDTSGNLVSNGRVQVGVLGQTNSAYGLAIAPITAAQSVWNLASINNSLSFRQGDNTTQTNNTEMMRIDSSGRVFKPYQPAFFATNNNASGVSYTSSFIVFPNTTLNTGDHYSTSTGRFTAPVSGLYHFNVHFFKFTNYQNGTNTYWGFTVNGGQILVTNHGAQDYDGGQSLSTAIYLNQNDYVNVARFNGTQIETFGSGVYHHFSGYMVG
jgi:hypothetical protein